MATTTRPLHGNITSLTQLNTGLQSLATNANLLVGFAGDLIDLTSSLALDVVIRGSIRTSASSTTAMPIAIYIIPEIADNVFGKTSAGTTIAANAALTFGNLDDRQNNAAFARQAVLTGTGALDYTIMEFSVASLFRGKCPRRFIPFVAQATGQPLAASGHALEYYTENLTTA